ncbi:MAG TPA: DEAD/DEAH box helicase [Chitinophagales bacterium]|nr:DEAD/DEAH box helicase [Chitinophagales bacterium]HQO30781.1 DEAD/DEAH box helicase [Chitinophagales bacterium]
MKFEEYPIAAEIKRNIEALGYKKPTDIQFKSIPAILNKEDVLAIAQTGTGKTAAFAIPVIHLIHERKRNRAKDAIKCVVMVPTHELAIQITQVFNSLAKHTKVKAFALFGGTEQQPQIDKLYQGVDILVATPGRLFDLRSQGYLDLSDIEILVLDEADHMLDLGFIGDIEDLIKFLPKHRQTLFFSATINEKIKKLAYSLVHKAIRIQISPKDPVAKNIQHAVAHIEMDDKRFFLERVIRENEGKKMIVFVRTKVRAERVAAAMQKAGIDTLTIHSDKDHKNRTDVMRQFREGKVRVLIATDVSARGIDIPNVDFVVNYDLPEVPENYVHRVGRTGRGMQKGQAVSFCSREEEPVLKEIEAFLGKPVVKLAVDQDTREEVLDYTEATKFTIKDVMRQILEAEQTPVKKGKKKK